MSNRKVAIAMNIIASILGWAAVGIGISAISSNNWISDGTIRRSGLWNLCTESVGCQPLTSDAWLQATRAFMILMVIFAFFGNMSNASSQCKPNKKAREGSGGSFSTAGTFGVIGAAIYTGFTTQGAIAVSYGYGFAAAWSAVGLAYLAGAFQQASVKNLPDEEEESHIKPKMEGP